MQKHGFMLRELTPELKPTDGEIYQHLIRGADGKIDKVNSFTIKNKAAPSKAQESLSVFVFEDQMRVLWGTLTFEKEGYPRVTLIYNVMWELVIIDLTILHPLETPRKVFELSSDRIKYMLHSHPADRTSIRLAADYYISAVLKLKTDPITRKMVHDVQLLVDDYERWPSI